MNEGVDDIHRLHGEVKLLEQYFHCKVNACQTVLKDILPPIPCEWNLPNMEINRKLEELFSSDWMQRTWYLFNEFLNENTNI